MVYHRNPKITVCCFDYYRAWPLTKQIEGVDYEGDSSTQVYTIHVYCCTWQIPEFMVNATGSDICEGEQQEIGSV